MADELKAKSEALIQGLVKDIKEKLPVLQKLRAMSELAKEIGDVDPAMDQVLETAESFAEMVLKKFDKASKKE